MVTESEKHAASLAVSRFGADGGRVQQTLELVLKAQALGQRADLLDSLVAEHLLTSSQAEELREALDATQFDLNAQPGEKQKSGAKMVRPARTLPPETDSPASGGAELRSLGEYRVLRRVGEGGMGAVYLGYLEAEKRQVAIKVLNDQLSSNQALVDRFYREARSGAHLDHPNIVRNIAVGQDRATGKHYLVLEYVDGPSAHALLDRLGRLSVGDATHLVLDIARALEHAHSRNIVHRDIKPGNILIAQSGLAKLADLGLAKRTDETSHLTAARQGFGTPYYMPYEQAMNAKSVDGRSDIYALGATLYHLVTGEVPFPGASHVEIVEKKGLGFFAPASTINPAIPEALDHILEKMLAREPRDRYQTASELIVDLERSNLAAAVPSFVNPDLALQDPVVRARLATPAQPTAFDIQRSLPKGEAPPANGHPDLWYLRYRDTTGRLCKAKATTKQVLQRLREGRLPAEVEASHQLQGQYEALERLPEFRDAAHRLVRRGKPGGKNAPVKKERAEPTPATAEDLPAAETRGINWWLIGLGFGIAVVIGLVVFLVRQTP
jgi:serine/threonine-protein kinase